MYLVVNLAQEDILSLAPACTSYLRPELSIFTLQETDISHLGKKKIIDSKSAGNGRGYVIVPRRVDEYGTWLVEFSRMVWGKLYSTCDFALKILCHYVLAIPREYPGKKICFLVVCCGPSMARFRNIDFDNVMLKCVCCVCCVCCSTLESSSRPSPKSWLVLQGWSMYAIDSGSLWTRRLVNLKILGPLFLVNDETMTNQFLGWARNQLPSKIPQNLGGGSEIYFRQKDRKGISIKGIFTGHVRMRFFFVLLIFNLRVHGYEISRLSNSASRGKQWRYHPRTLHKPWWWKGATSSIYGRYNLRLPIDKAVYRGYNSIYNWLGLKPCGWFWVFAEGISSYRNQ